MIDTKRICLECGKKFETPQWRIKHGRGKYCSKKCFYIAKARNQTGKPIHSEVEKQRRREKIKGKNNPMFGKNKELNPNWKGGKTIDKRFGYILTRMPYHPRANSYSGYVYEHILVMEKKLNRPILNYERIHHVDGNPQNNHADNLRLFPNDAEHARLHNSERRRNIHGQYY